MWPIVTVVEWSVLVSFLVYMPRFVYDLLITRVSCDKTAEPIEMPFGLWTPWGPGPPSEEAEAFLRKHVQRLLPAAVDIVNVIR